MSLHWINITSLSFPILTSAMTIHNQFVTNARKEPLVPISCWYWVRTRTVMPQIDRFIDIGGRRRELKFVCLSNTRIVEHVVHYPAAAAAAGIWLGKRTRRPTCVVVLHKNEAQSPSSVQSSRDIRSGHTYPGDRTTGTNQVVELRTCSCNKWNGVWLSFEEVFWELFVLFLCWNPWPPVKWQGTIVINPVIYSAVSLELRGIQLPTVLLHKKPSLRVRFWNFKQFTIFCGLVKNSCFGVEIVD